MTWQSVTTSCSGTQIAQALFTSNGQAITATHAWIPRMFIKLFAKSIVASALIGAIMVAQVAAAEAEQNQETNNWFDKAFEEYLVEYKRYKDCISYSANHFNLDKELMVAIL